MSGVLQSHLTDAEAAVLALIAGGLSTREIAAHLSISVGTVKCHVHHIFGKLEARNRIEAISKVSLAVAAH